MPYIRAFEKSPIGTLTYIKGSFSLNDWIDFLDENRTLYRQKKWYKFFEIFQSSDSFLLANGKNQFSIASILPVLTIKKSKGEWMIDFWVLEEFVHFHLDSVIGIFQFPGNLVTHLKTPEQQKVSLILLRSFTVPATKKEIPVKNFFDNCKCSNEKKSSKKSRYFEKT